MMSFGAVLVDQHGFIDRFPGTAMFTGLIANALGWHHGDFDRLQALQERIDYAARWDVQPERLVDYQTVDLGQPKMCQPGWTSRGRPEHRGGGPGAKYGTHQRYRHYWVDGLMTVALALSEGEPDLDTVRAALHEPARPLFLGRKTCLPARPLLDTRTPVAEGESLLTILRQVPIWDRSGSVVPNVGSVEACWPAESGTTRNGRLRRVYDLRDWANQIPANSRARAEGLIGEEEP
jgi:CRISPR system Cascade subunit CasD